VLADAQKKLVTVEPGDEGLILKLPKAAPDPICSTIALQLREPLQIEAVPIAPARDGTITLPAADARLHGNTFKYEVGGPLDDIGFWTDPSDWADWPIRVRAPGRYTIAAVIAAPASGAFDVSIGGQSIRCAAPVTANYFDFKLAILGTIDVSSAGVTTLAVRPVTDAWKPMNLKSVTLIPRE
jgi:hypothetical protein